MDIETLSFRDGRLRLIDQRRLPGTVEFYEANTYQDVVEAIREMVVRGAPAIGAAGAYGVYLAARQFRHEPEEEFERKLRNAVEDLAGARPTAVNLTWAIGRMMDVFSDHKESPREQSLKRLREEADRIAQEDVEINRQMARHGNEIVPEDATILTHCNTGSLATVGYGTALGVIREAHRSGKNIEVYADETRPRAQGARLTAFELVQEDIPSKLIADSAAARAIQEGRIDLVLVGADRVAANGDTANKVGTYMLSEIARTHGVPFYVVAPTSTIDDEVESGDEIEIEERAPDELTHIGDTRIAPEEIDVYNPAFDITPAENITGIITEQGIARPPFEDSLARLKGKTPPPRS